MANEDYETFKLGDWELQSGEKIADAHIAFKTFGDPKSPAIVYPTWFSGGNFRYQKMTSKGIR
jgi:homoserine acetyltransferase